MKIINIIGMLMLVLFWNSDLLAQKNIAENEKNALLFLLEEEKMARDIYVVLGEKWEHHVFENIQQAEQKHLDKVSELLTKRGITIPATIKEDKPGELENPKLKNLYNELLKKGKKSLIDALEVGAKIEELDISDLEEGLVFVKNEEQRKVMENLLKASKNHLRAFTKNLKKQGVDYKPTVLEMEAYNKIISLENEKTCKGGKGKVKECCKKKS